MGDVALPKHFQEGWVDPTEDFFWIYFVRICLKRWKIKTRAEWKFCLGEGLGLPPRTRDIFRKRLLYAVSRYGLFNGRFNFSFNVFWVNLAVFSIGEGEVLLETSYLIK